MTVTLNLPPQVEQAYLAVAEARGLPLDAIVQEVVIAGQPANGSTKSVFEQGLGLLSSSEDSAVLDEVVSVAYEERRRPAKPGPF